MLQKSLEKRVPTKLPIPWGRFFNVVHGSSGEEATGKAAKTGASIRERSAAMSRLRRTAPAASASPTWLAWRHVIVSHSHRVIQ